MDVAHVRIVIRFTRERFIALLTLECWTLDVNVFDVLPKTENARITLSTVSTSMNELLIVRQMRVGVNSQVPSFLE